MKHLTGAITAIIALTILPATGFVFENCEFEKVANPVRMFVFGLNAQEHGNPTMRNQMQNSANQVESREKATEYLENLSCHLTELNTVNTSVESYVSAMAGFLEDYKERNEMSAEEYRRLCVIVLESLFYE